MSAATTKLMTAEEFFEWQDRAEDQDKRFELVRGEIEEMPSPGERHGVVCANVAWVLGSFVRQRKKGYILSNDPGIVLERDPDTVRGPDVVLFEGLRSYADLNPKFAEGVPTLAVEVLSPHDRIGKVTRRIDQFLKSGIGLVWLVDPESKDVTVYRADKKPYVLGETEELSGDDILPDFRCKVADFFFVS